MTVRDGTYKCAAAASDDCTVNIDTRWVRSADMSAPIFGSSFPIRVSPSDVADCRLHVQYGAWLQKTTDEDGVVDVRRGRDLRRFVD